MEWQPSVSRDECTVHIAAGGAADGGHLELSWVAGFTVKRSARTLRHARYADDQWRCLSSSRWASADLPTSSWNLPTFFSSLPAISFALLPVTLPTTSFAVPLIWCLVPSTRL